MQPHVSVSANMGSLAPHAKKTFADGQFIKHPSTLAPEGTRFHVTHRIIAALKVANEPIVAPSTQIKRLSKLVVRQPLYYVM